MSYLKSALKEDQGKLSKSKQKGLNRSVLSSLEKKSRKSLLRDQDERYSKERSKSIQSMLSATSSSLPTQQSRERNESWEADLRSADPIHYSNDSDNKRPEFDTLSVLAMGRASFRRGSMQAPEGTTGGSPSSYSNRKQYQDTLNGSINSNKSNSKKVVGGRKERDPGQGLEEYNPSKDYFSESAPSLYSYQYNQLKSNHKNKTYPMNNNSDIIDIDSSDEDLFTPRSNQSSDPGHSSTLYNNNNDYESRGPMSAGGTHPGLLHRSSVYNELDELITTTDIQEPTEDGAYPHGTPKHISYSRSGDEYDTHDASDTTAPALTTRSPAFVYMSRKGNLMSKFGGANAGASQGADQGEKSTSPESDNNLSLSNVEDQAPARGSGPVMLGSVGSTPPTSPHPKLGTTLAGHSLASSKTRRIQQVRTRVTPLMPCL